MERIKSFEINHDTLSPGIYLSRKDGDIDTYDMRFKLPNGGDFLSNESMHTIEHIFATFVRNSEFKESIIYFGPMGCRTGFYFLVRDMEEGDVISLIKQGIGYVVGYHEKIPGCSRIECGNFEEHDLLQAKTDCGDYLAVIINTKGCRYPK